jgi:hypothetical protein
VEVLTANATHTANGLAGLCLVWTALAAPVCGQVAAEYEVKAAFLYKFASFVEWPALSPDGQVCIGVLGADPFGASLDETIRGKSVNGRGFAIRRIKSGQDASACQIVFVSPSEKKTLPRILAALEGVPVLTVGDTPGFCESGGIVNLEVQDSKVRLQVNLEAAEKAGLRLSSKLLSLATVVRRHAR